MLRQAMTLALVAVVLGPGLAGVVGADPGAPDPTTCKVNADDTSVSCKGYKVDVPDPTLPPCTCDPVDPLT